MNDAIKLAMCERSLQELSRAANTQAEEDKATIATLRAEVARLRGALDRIAGYNNAPVLDGAAHEIARATVNIARAALTQEPTNDR